MMDQPGTGESAAAPDPDFIEEVAAIGRSDVLDPSLLALGRRIRLLRQDHRMTLQALASATGLSISMISLAERGLTSPSIGSLVVIASALRVPLSDLFAEVGKEENDRVVRFEDQPVVSPWPGVSRRIAKIDRHKHVEISVNEWGQEGDAEPQSAKHPGFEFGLLLEGKLTVEVDDQSYELLPGDLISYSSDELHSLKNSGDGVAKAVWINLHSF